LTIKARVIITDRDKAPKTKKTDEKPNVKIFIASDHTLITNLSLNFRPDFFKEGDFYLMRQVKINQKALHNH
jgi:hypothetical protein